MAEGADVIGASILSGSHLELAEQIMAGLRAAGAGERIQLVMGGIIPPGDFEALKARGVRRVFTPADFGLVEVMEKIADLIEERAARG